MTPEPAAPRPKLRRSVRALVVDPADRLLLAQLTLPHVTLWAAPGGGIEPGEDDLTALRRELREEIGLDLVGEPPLIWRRTVVLAGAIPGFDGQEEGYHWVRTDPFEPRGELNDAELAAEHLVRFRWWTLDELEATDAVLAPRDLAARFGSLLRDGVPAAPLDLGL